MLKNKALAKSEGFVFKSFWVIFTPFKGPIAPHPESYIMFCVYVIKSKKDSSIYIGYTDNLKRRLTEHNKNQSNYTKGKGPYDLVYFEGYKSMKDAKYRETQLKKFSQAYTQLKRRIINSLE